jgi:hypothetical protein
MRKHQEELKKRLEEMRPPDFTGPPPFEPPTIPGGGISGLPGSDSDPAAEARRQIEQLQVESRRRIEEMREKSRQRREEVQKRIDGMRSRRP